ncbi:MAG: RluA family pseudouridine synthase [Planctomycetes bacterium]|nr:RluA family pseudouridine synthase [Planctomycetota bacterium]
MEAREQAAGAREKPEDSAQTADSQDAAVERITKVVRRRLVGRRLDKYLRGLLPRLSRTVIQRLIKQGDVTVNGQPTKASYEPNKGDVIVISVPPPEPTDIVGEDIPLDIIYEDDYLLAINKQAGIICHPARASQGGTIANAAMFHLNNISHGDDPLRPGIIHRLDKNTTGVMLIAKCDEAHWRISLQFEKRTIQKTYVGIVEGDVQLDQDIIDAPLAAHPTIKDRYMVPGMRRVPMITKQAITQYQVLERFRGFALMQLQPKTGRTHQLRVHMSYIGHPMVGDLTYGGHFFSEHDLTGQGSTEPLIDHQSLHARRIKFVHPIKETPLEIEAPLSGRIARVVELLREHRKL